MGNDVDANIVPAKWCMLCPFVPTCRCWLFSSYLWECDFQTLLLWFTKQSLNSACVCVDGGEGISVLERLHSHLMSAVIGNRCFVTPSVNTRLNKHAYFCPRLTRTAATHEFYSFSVLGASVKAPFKRQSPVFKTACLTYFLLSPFLTVPLNLF